MLFLRFFIAWVKRDDRKRVPELSSELWDSLPEDAKSLDSAGRRLHRYFDLAPATIASRNRP